MVPVATSTLARAATQTAAPIESTCAGDCNGDWSVTLDELVQAINVALGLTANGICPRLDGNLDGLVAIDEVIKAVGSALDGCGTAVE
jgi:hypothetical protein